MKDLFLNKSLNMLQAQYQYNDEMLDRVKYGLEIIYISITKISVILIISIILHCFKETFLTVLFMNFLRMFAYGLHAKKSWHCYISSTFSFVILPIIFTNIEFDLIQKIIISILTFISFILYAPADTYKRPLINQKHRKKLKISTLIVSLIYIISIFIINDNYITNLLILSLIIQSFLINPFIYRIFDLPYNNYKSYKKGCN